MMMVDMGASLKQKHCMRSVSTSMQCWALLDPTALLLSCISLWIFHWGKMISCF
jgi:hypothetical protein